MKVIHKISPVLILAGYFYILYEGYFLCQFGGVRYHSDLSVSLSSADDDKFSSINC